jgi:peptide-methionine (R)-S-oxide reductase
VKRLLLLLAIPATLGFVLFATPAAAGERTPRPAVPRVPAEAPDAPPFTKLERTEEEWQRRLTAGAFRVLRQEGTETAFTGAYWQEHRAGRYRCAGCGLELFGSDTKFDSGTGWPSFWRPAFRGVVTEKRDASHGMLRVEVECARCGGHLGHVFDDGPRPTGLRYCINSAALDFVPGR